MEYHEILKSTFKTSYNISKVLTSKLEIMKYLENYKDDDRHAVAFGVRKTQRDTTPIWFKSFEQKIDQKFSNIERRLDAIESRIDKIESRLDRIVQLNNLKE
ncbi:MAG: hypothetical protein KBS35_02130 [Mycoplasma sp.]|nr:hypothetical protein [Candidatus Hennigella equi]